MTHQASLYALPGQNWSPAIISDFCFPSRRGEDTVDDYQRIPSPMSTWHARYWRFRSLVAAIIPCEQDHSIFLDNLGRSKGLCPLGTAIRMASEIHCGTSRHTWRYCQSPIGLQRYILPRYTTYLDTRTAIRCTLRYITVRDKTGYQQLTLLSNNLFP